MFSSFNAIVPMACVTAAGIAAMVAEAFREPGERMPIGPLGAIGLVGAAHRHGCCCGTATPPASASSSADNFGLFVTGDPDRRRPAVAGDLRRRPSSASGCRGGEYYALMLFAMAGMMLMATATDLLVIFLALEVLSLAVYVLTGIRRDSATGDRGGVQVLPARRVLERVLPLRHRVHLRRDRQHAARRVASNGTCANINGFAYLGFSNIA